MTLVCGLLGEQGAGNSEHSCVAVLCVCVFSGVCACLYVMVLWSLLLSLSLCLCVTLCACLTVSQSLSSSVCVCVCEKERVCVLGVCLAHISVIMRSHFLWGTDNRVSHRSIVRGQSAAQASVESAVVFRGVAGGEDSTVRAPKRGFLVHVTEGMDPEGDGAPARKRSKPQGAPQEVLTDEEDGFMRL